MMAALLSIAAPCAGVAALVIIRVTGVVTSGIDQTGVFGPPNTNLAGKGYTQVFTIDDTKGTKTVTVGKPPYASNIAATAGSNPMTATITIGSGTVYYGVRPTNAPPNSLVSRQGDQMSISTGGESYWVGNAVGEGSMEAVINFASPPYTANYNWESVLDYTMATNNTSGGSFLIAYGNSITGKWLQSADGLLKVTNVTEIGPITPPLTPHIFFFDAAKGQLFDVTNTTVPVVVGQPIYLYAIPGGTPAQPKAWNVLGNPIGAYLLSPNTMPDCAEVANPSSGCAEIALPDFTHESTKFYWTEPGTYTVQYNSVSGVAKAAFSVSGPTSVEVSPHTAAIASFVNVLNNGENVENVYWGGAQTKTPGISLIAEAVQPRQTGEFRWVQLIKADKLVYQFLDGFSEPCAPGIGLDNSFFYPFTSTDTKIPDYIVDNCLEDNPRSALELTLSAHGTSINVTRTMQGQSFLMWQPNITDSIPVTLGYEEWSVMFGADLDSQSMPGKTSWAPFAYGKTFPFVKTTAYPTWTERVQNGGGACN